MSNSIPKNNNSNQILEESWSNTWWSKDCSNEDKEYLIGLRNRFCSFLIVMKDVPNGIKSIWIGDELIWIKVNVDWFKSLI